MNFYILRSTAFAVLISLASYTTALCQSINLQIDDVVMPSIDATNYGQLAEFNIEHSTGAGNLNIPLYSLVDHDINHSLGVTYNTSGIKLGEPAGPVGLGFNLNAGGMVTRTVHGIRDEDPNGFINVYDYDSLTDASIISIQNMHDIKAGLLDSEPDVFSFNCGDLNGKFVIYGDEIITYPDSEIKVEYEIADNINDINFHSILDIKVPVIIGFIITNVDGVKYHFGIPDTGDLAIEVSKQIGKGRKEGMVEKFDIDGWKITKIVAPSGREIVFNYKNGVAYHTKYRSSVYTESYICNIEYAHVHVFSEQKTGINFVTAGMLNQNISPNYYIENHIISAQLDSIVSEYESIVFQYGNERDDIGTGSGFHSLPKKKVLDEIIVFKNSQHFKSFEFDYDYFTNGSANLDITSRLKLLSIKEKGINSASLPPYQFHYIPGELPDRLSSSIDWWGYHNGAGNTGIPNVPGFGSDRNTNESEMLKGMLDSIEYPSGLKIGLQYEANSFYNPKTYIDTSVIHNFTEGGDCGSYSTEGNFTYLATDSPDSLAIDFKFTPDTILCSPDATDFYTFLIIDSNNDTIGTKSGSFKSDEVYHGFEFFSNIVNSGTLVPGEVYTFKIIMGQAPFELGVELVADLIRLEEKVIGNVLVGGLRLKNIVTDDGNDKSITNYNYEVDSQSTGLLFAKPHYSIFFSDTSAIYLKDDSNESADSVGYIGVNSRFIFDLSVVPLNHIMGSHITYLNVTEDITGKGKINYKFHPGDTFSQHILNITFAPSQYDGYRGKLLKKEVYNESDELQVSEEYNYVNISSFDSIHYPAVKVTSMNFECGGPGGIRQYHIKTGNIKTSKITSVNTDVTSIDSFQYDSNFNVSKKTKSDLDGQTKTTDYYYASDLSNTLLIDSNMLSIPLKVVKDDGAGGGYKIDYKLENDGIVPYKYYSINNDGSPKLMKHVQSFNGIYPATVWDKQKQNTIDYNYSDGLIEDITYHNRFTDYNYYGNRLLKDQTDFNGIYSEVIYDDLHRPKDIEDLNGRIKTEGTYSLGLHSGGTNLMTKTVNYPLEQTYSLPDITTETIVDGYYRPFSETILGYTHPGNDWVSTTDRSPLGGIESTCDQSTGGCVENTLEASPLERVKSSKHSAQSGSISYTYEANSSGDVPGYSPGTLFKTTIKDENGNETINYKDIFGRLVCKEDALGGKTIYTYNERDQKMSVTQPGVDGPAFTYTYHNDGLIHTKSIPDKGTYTYTYNSNDQLQYETLPSGEQLEYIYDSNYNDFLTTVKLDGTVIKSYSQYNDKSGWVDTAKVAVQDENGNWMGFNTTVYDYDDIGRVTSEIFTDVYGNTVSREHIDYDDAGNIRRDSVHYDLASGSSFSVLYEYAYDKGIRQIGTTITYDGPEGTYTMPVNQLQYDDHDWLDNNTIGQLQTIEYGYTGPGWLKSINSIRGTLPRKRLKQPCDDIVQDFPSVCGEYEEDVVWVEVDYNCEEMGSGMETVMQVRLSTPSGYVGVPPLTFNIPIQGDPPSSPPGSDDLYTGKLNVNNVFEDLHNTLRDLFLSCAQSATSDYRLLGRIKIQTVLKELKEEIDQFTKQEKVESLFGMTLSYEEGNDDLQAPPRYNGDVSWMEWSVAGEPSVKAYGFQYDELNRLKQAINLERVPDCEDYIENSGPYDVTGINYDARGNITTLKRRGKYLNGTSYLDKNIDNLSYAYQSGTNKLNAVTENLSTIYGLNEGLKGTADYTYDSNGRVTAITYANDATKNFGPYTHQDLPLQITRGNRYAKNHYTADGEKTLTKRYVNNNFNWEEQISTYLGNVELKNGNFHALNHEEGRLLKDDNGNMHQEYFIKDHLGNIRVRFEDSDEDGEIQYEFPVDNEYEESELISSYHYYPFGMEWKGHFYANPDTEVQRKRFNGKEYEEGLGLLDYGARYYDPVVARWDVVDPLAEEMPEWSTYNYTFNNPIRFIDPDGTIPEKPDWVDNGDGTYTAEKGDGAWTLSEDAGISYERAKEILTEQGHESYVDEEDGVEKTAVDPNDVVSVPEQVEEVDQVNKIMDETSKQDNMINNNRNAIQNLMKTGDSLGNIIGAGKEMDHNINVLLTPEVPADPYAGSVGVNAGKAILGNSIYPHREINAKKKIDKKIDSLKKVNEKLEND